MCKHDSKDNCSDPLSRSEVWAFHALCLCPPKLGPSPSFRLCPRPQIGQCGKWPLRAQCCPTPSPVHTTLVLTLHNYSMSCHLPSICTERLPLRRCPLSSLGPQKPVWYSTQGHLFNCQWLTEGKNGFTDGSCPSPRQMSSLITKLPWQPTSNSTPEKLGLHTLKIR